MLIWRGAGAFVFILGILMALLTNIVTSRIFDENNYFQTHPWAQALALWLTGVSCWFLGRYLHRQPGRVVLNKDTGQEEVVKLVHSLFFIKLEYWGPILFVIGVCVLVFER